MDLQSRKIQFVQAFLKLQSEEVISQLEQILKKESKLSNDEDFQPMTTEQLNERISKSESDFANGRFKTSSDLLSKYKK